MSSNFIKVHYIPANDTLGDYWESPYSRESALMPDEVFFRGLKYNWDRLCKEPVIVLVNGDKIDTIGTIELEDKTYSIILFEDNEKIPMIVVECLDELMDKLS